MRPEYYNLYTMSVLMMSLLITAACRTEKTDIPAIRTAVERGEKIFSDALVGGEYGPLRELYSESAVLMPPNALPLMGREAIIGYFKEGSVDGSNYTSADFSSLDVDGEGALAYARGSYVLTLEGAGSSHFRDEGKYLAIWRLEEDGNWRIQADIWNSNFDKPVHTDSVP